MASLITTARRAFHERLVQRLLVVDAAGVASNADKDQRASRDIARSIADSLGATAGKRLDGQTAGDEFEKITAEFLEATFPKLDHLRPGKWSIVGVRGRGGLPIAKFDQYRHLVALAVAAATNPDLAISLGNDYAICPDILVSRGLEGDERINAPGQIVDDLTATGAVIREKNGGLPVLHASVSCKWTMRSDRAQNARSEALNLIRNRKGRTPHIAVVTGEPTPSRLSSLALGTGDIDCVYHFALAELRDAVDSIHQSEASALLRIMIDGKRLKDIADLPLDLAV